MRFYHHQGQLYRIIREVRHHNFENTSMVKEFMGTMFNCDHVLKNQTHYLFCETVQEAEVIEYL